MRKQGERRLEERSLGSFTRKFELVKINRKNVISYYSIDMAGFVFD
jgi:hypothetical protein